MENRAFIVFSGNNERGTVAFLREAARLHAAVFIIAAGRDDVILGSDYLDRVVHIRTDRSLAVPDILRWADAIRQRSGYTRFVILPSSEFLNRFLLRNRAELERHGICVPLVDEEIYCRISDKESFTALCQAYGLAVPGTIEWDSDVAFPVVAKPRRYFANSGAPLAKPAILRDIPALTEFRRRPDREDWCLQEFIEGRSFYLLFWISRHGRHVAFSQENLVQQGGGRSIIAARSTRLHEEAIAQRYLQMFEAVGFHGLVMVEVRAGSTGYVMIEANPRVWGPSQLFVDAGVPIFERLMVEYEVVKSVSAPSTKPASALYFWSGGLRGYGADLYGLTADNWREIEPQFQEVEIFRRPDTLGIWRKENERSC